MATTFAPIKYNYNGTVDATYINEALKSLPEGEYFKFANGEDAWVKRGGNLVKVTGNTSNIQTIAPFSYQTYASTPGDVKYQGGEEAMSGSVIGWNPTTRETKTFSAGQLPTGWQEKTTGLQSSIEQNTPVIINGKSMSREDANLAYLREQVLKNPNGGKNLDIYFKNAGLENNSGNLSLLQKGLTPLTWNNAQQLWQSKFGSSGNMAENINYFINKGASLEDFARQIGVNPVEQSAIGKGLTVNGGAANPLDPFNTGKVYNPNADLKKGFYAYNPQGGITWVEGNPNATSSVVSQPQTQVVDIANKIMQERLTRQGYTDTSTPSTNTITPESLTKTYSLNVPSGNVDTGTTANMLVAGANTSLQNLISQLTPAETATDKKQQSLLDSMASLVGQQGQKSADQLTAEQSAGLPALRQQFADINAKILTKMAEYNALEADIQGKPITMSSIIGAQAQIRNVKASEIGLLQAQAQGLQGQISAAQDTVNRAIDLKYSTIESQLNTYKAQLEALQPELNREEKQQAMNQQLILNQQQQAIEDAKLEEKNIQNVMLEAINSGIKDNSVLSKISSAKSYNEALNILGTNMPNQAEKTEIREIANHTWLINSQTGEKIKDLGYSGPTVSSNSNTKVSAEEKAWEADLKNAREKLASKGSAAWGEVWNYLYNQYGVPPDQLDAILNKDFYSTR